MQAILEFDKAVFLFFENYLWSPFADLIMTFITKLGDGGIIWIIIGILLLFFKKYRKVGAMVIVGLLCSLVINDYILKPLINRPRPFDLDLEFWKAFYKYPDLVTRPSSVSFPSGHTSSSFAAATAIVFSRKKRIWIPSLVLAFLIAFSRIYVHVHYCTDVLAGLLVGVLYGLLAYLIIEKLFLPLIEKIKNKRKTASAK